MPSDHTKAQQPAPEQRCHNSASATPAVDSAFDTDDSSDDQPLAAYREEQNHK